MKTKFLILCLCVCLCLGAVGCRKVQTPSHTDSQTTAPAEQREPLPTYDYDLSSYVQLGKYIGVEIPAIDTAVTDAQMTKYLDSLRAAHAEKEAVTNRSAQAGDTLLLDYAGKSDGVSFGGGTAQGVTLTVGGDDSPFPGLDTALVGTLTGETRTVEITMPEDEKYMALSGKTLQFSVTVHEIYRLVYPALDDAFAVLCGYESLDALRASAEETLLSQNIAAAAQERTSAVWETVMEQAQILKYPDDAVDYYYNELYTYYDSYAQYASTDLETYLKQNYGMDLTAFQQQCYTYSRQSVAEDLVMFSIIRAEGITLSDQEYEQGLQEYTVKYEMTKEKLLEVYTEQGIRRSLLWEKTWDYLAAHAKEV